MTDQSRQKYGKHSYQNVCNMYIFLRLENILKSCLLNAIKSELDTITPWLICQLSDSEKETWAYQTAYE